MIASDARVFTAIETLLRHGADVNLQGGRLERTPLMHAAARANLPLMRLFIGRGARVDVRDRKRWSAIRIAHAEAKSEPAVALLASNGANRGDLLEDELIAAYEAKDAARITALARGGTSVSVAMERGSSILSDAIRDRNDDLALLLLRLGADPDFGGTGTPPLNSAATQGNERLLSALLAAGADPNIVSTINVTPLLSSFRHPEITRLLIAAGADVNLVPERNESPLGRATRMAREDASERDRYEKVARLLRTAGATIRGTHDHPLREAAVRGDLERSRSLLPSAGDDEREASLVAAAVGGHPAVVRHLLVEGVPAHAANGDWSATAAAAAAGNVETMRLLLDRGADPERGDAAGLSPIAIAAMNGHGEIISLLRQRGASKVADRALMGRALIDAAERGDAQTVKALLEAGADLQWRGTRFDHPMPALFVAANHDRGDVLRVLIAAGADVNSREQFFHTHTTPLMTASLAGATNAVRVLLEAGADPAYADERGTTALEIAEGQAEVNYLGRRAEFERIAAMLR